MILATLILLALSVIIIVSYPLVRLSLQDYILPTPDTERLQASDTLLSALSELEEDFQMERISLEDYQRQKLMLQRQYLTLSSEKNRA